MSRKLYFVFSVILVLVAAIFSIVLLFSPLFPLGPYVLIGFGGDPLVIVFAILSLLPLFRLFWGYFCTKNITQVTKRFFWCCCSPWVFCR